MHHNLMYWLIILTQQTGIYLIEQKYGGVDNCNGPTPPPGTAGVNFGPQGCITLHTNKHCIIQTNCDGLDLTSVEFAFDCKMENYGVERHTFGIGGFDPEEL